MHKYIYIFGLIIIGLQSLCFCSEPLILGQTDSSASTDYYYEPPLIKNDFDRCFPKSAMSYDTVVQKHWNFRRSSWSSDNNDVVLNSTPNAPSIFYPVTLNGEYKIIVGARAVSVISSFALVFSKSKDTAIIAPPTVAFGKDHDIEIELPKVFDLSGENIEIRNLGNLSYLRYFKFVKVLKKVNSAKVESIQTIFSEKDRHFAFPGFCMSRSGKLLVVAREGRFHVAKGDFGSIVLSVSVDGGKTWSAKANILSKTGIDYRDPALCSLSDGSILLSYNTFSNVVSSEMLKSTDDGKTWNFLSTTNDVFSPNGPMEYKHKVYYCGNRTLNNVNYIDILESNDYGAHWSDYSTVVLGKPLALRWTNEYYDEPSLAVLSDSSWMCLSRVDLNLTIYQSISGKKGAFKSWSYPISTGIFGTPPHMVNLRNGNMLCSYGRRQKPYSIRACVYDVAQHKWLIQNESILVSDLPNTDLGYAKTVELQDQTFLTVFYAADDAATKAEVKIVKWKLKQ